MREKPQRIERLGVTGRGYIAVSRLGRRIKIEAYDEITSELDLDLSVDQARALRSALDGAIKTAEWLVEENNAGTRGR